MGAEISHAAPGGVDKHGLDTDRTARYHSPFAVSETKGGTKSEQQEDHIQKSKVRLD